MSLIKNLSLLGLLILFQGCASSQLAQDGSGESEKEITRRPDSTQMTDIANMHGTGFGTSGPLSYSISLSRPQIITEQAATLGSISHKLSSRFSVWRSMSNSLFLTAGIESVQFRTEAIFPESGTPFPEKIWNLNVGSFYSHRFTNGWNAGVMVNLSSSGDRPLDSFDELKVGGLAYLRIPSGADNSWRFTVRYAPRSEINRVLPGVAYSWRVSPSLRLNIGIPFGLNWQLSPDFSFDAVYAPVTMVRLKTVWNRASYPITLMCGFDWNGRSSSLADRENEEDRFSYNEKNVTIGGQYAFRGLGSLELTGGYAFDRYFYIGEDYSDTDTDRIDVEPGAFLRVGFNFAFQPSDR